MTLDTSVSAVTRNGNGVATVFDFPFKVWKDADIQVLLTDSTGAVTETTNFTVDIDTGMVTYPTTGDPLPAGSKITILRALDFLQAVDLVAASRFDSAVIEAALDYNVALAQQLKEELGRTVKISVTDTTTSTDATTMALQVEAAKTAAQAAQAGAEDAQTAAESAQTAAETAQGLAEGARDSALAYRNTAQAAQSAASTAQAGAENARDAALVAQGAAEDARDAAALSESNAEDFADTAALIAGATAWDSGVTYAANNCVIYEGDTWRALQSSTNVTPVEGAYWHSLTGFQAALYTTTTPTLTGDASATEGTEINITVSNYDSAATYTASVTGGTLGSPTAGVWTWTMPLVSADTSYTFSISATKAGELRSLAATKTVTALNVPIVDGPTITLDDDADGFPDGDFN